MENRKNVFLVYLILGIGIFLRFYRLGKLCFWCDEFLAIFLGEKPISLMVEYITFKDAHPPLFYLIVHFLLKGGNSEFYLRLFPAFFGILCIPLAYILGKELLNEKTGLIFSLIIALNPAHVLWAQILKSYTFFTFFLLVSFYFFLKIIKREKITYWVFLFLVNIILLYTHNFSFLVIVIQGIYLIFKKKLTKKWIFYYFFLLFAYFPWLLRIPSQLKFTLGVRRQIPLIFRYFYIFFYFFLGETVNPFNFYVICPAVIVFSTLIFKGMIELKELKREENFVVYLGLFLPLSLVPFPSTVPQNLLPYSVFWLFLISVGISEIKYQRIFLSIIIFIFSISNFFHFTGRVSQFHDVSKLVPYREIGKFMSIITEPEDIIFSTEKRQLLRNRTFSPFEWYYRGKATVIEAIPEKLKIEDIPEIVENHKRIWVFFDYNENPSWSEVLKKYFESNYKKVWSEKYLYNEKLLSRLKGKKEYTWFAEICVFEK
ncbi:MAG: hypothetical protein B6D55_07610 [Candidatus Omnitrophica bacterium 4484_70.2]|nr:MAG: hypothetical protein B6D55_07610 [Candidatus Omnitrophica bacterium 4484_70.2]